MRKLLKWNDLKNPSAGYSLIIGANVPLLNLLPLHLKLIASQNAPNLKSIIVVVDTPRSLLQTNLSDELAKQFPQLPIQFHFYSSRQYRLLQKLNWSKCYSFLSWAIGLSYVQTRYALLHDFDAFLLDPHFLESRYEILRSTTAHFLGIETYQHAQIRHSDQLAATWEMMFAAAYVRNCHKPLDIFNRLCWFNGRLVNLDTFHDIERQSGRIVVASPDYPDVIMHATQMICQCTHLHQQVPYIAPTNTTLLLAPYLLYAAGDPTEMESIVKQLEYQVNASVSVTESKYGTLKLFGRIADFSVLHQDRLNGLRAMATSIEKTLGYKTLRDLPSKYFDWLENMIDSKKQKNVESLTFCQAA